MLMRVSRSEVALAIQQRRHQRPAPYRDDYRQRLSSLVSRIADVLAVYVEHGRAVSPLTFTEPDFARRFLGVLSTSPTHHRSVSQLEVVIFHA